MGKNINQEPVDRESERALSYLSFLIKAVKQIGTSLDYEETLKQIAQSMVPDLSDWCGVDILQEDGSIKRLAIAHVDPDKINLALQSNQLYPPKPATKGGSQEVLKTGVPVLLNGITDEMLVAAAEDERHLQIMRDLEFSSLMIVPIKSRNTVLGTITLVWSTLEYNYNLADLAFAETLASVAGAAIDNSRLYQNALKQTAAV